MEKPPQEIPPERNPSTCANKFCTTPKGNCEAKPDGQGVNLECLLFLQLFRNQAALNSETNNP